MKALIFKNKVVEMAAQEFPVSSEMQWLDAPEGCQVGWLLENGSLISDPAQEKTPDEILEEEMPGDKEMLQALWKWAKTNNKSDINNVDAKIDAAHQKAGKQRKN